MCTRAHESDRAGGYRAVNPSGTYRGAYQFSRSTWDNTARHAGRPDLVGVDPAAAAPADQDFLAFDLYQWQGAAPWGGRCAGQVGASQIECCVALGVPPGAGCRGGSRLTPYVRR